MSRLCPFVARLRPFCPISSVTLACTDLVTFTNVVRPFPCHFHPRLGHSREAFSNGWLPLCLPVARLGELTFWIPDALSELKFLPQNHTLGCHHMVCLALPCVPAFERMRRAVFKWPAFPWFCAFTRSASLTLRHESARRRPGDLASPRAPVGDLMSFSPDAGANCWFLSRGARANPCFRPALDVSPWRRLWANRCLSSRTPGRIAGFQLRTDGRRRFLPAFPRTWPVT
jgi:hypothetical protein